MKDCKLTDVSQLDWVSYDDVDKILQTYEETRAIVEYRLRQMGDLTDATVYKKFDELLGELKQSKDIQRRRAIAGQIKEYYEKAGVKNDEK